MIFAFVFGPPCCLSIWMCKWYFQGSGTALHLHGRLQGSLHTFIAFGCLPNKTEVSYLIFMVWKHFMLSESKL